MMCTLLRKQPFREMLGGQEYRHSRCTRAQRGVVKAPAKAKKMNDQTDYLTGCPQNIGGKRRGAGFSRVDPSSSSGSSHAWMAWVGTKDHGKNQEYHYLPSPPQVAMVTNKAF
eukprot:Sspe_Gene.49801::Locus_27161_Transcript_1_1_Confidence_1.000_Length_569::g.49801::m.49801